MIEIHDIHFRYLKKPLFQGLDLTLEPGNLYGLLGKNGAGKTTLLKLCCGLLYPQGGTLRVFDRVPHLRQPAFLSDLFLVPEEFSLPAVSGALYRDMLAPLYPAFSRQRLEAHLAEFDLPMPDRLDRLSHGQKKKFLLAIFGYGVFRLFFVGYFDGTQPSEAVMLTFARMGVTGDLHVAYYPIKVWVEWISRIFFWGAMPLSALAFAYFRLRETEV